MNEEIIVFDEEIFCDLDELCCLCRVTTSHVIELVEEGVITPVESENSAWHFDFLAIRRLQTAVRLQQDLDVNVPGVALILDLLDEVRQLRQQCRGKV